MKNFDSHGPIGHSDFFRKTKSEQINVKLTQSQKTSKTCDTFETLQLSGSDVSSFVTTVKQAFENSICVGDNKGLLLCTNGKCQEHAVICAQRKCACKEKHKCCLIAQIDGFLEKYQTKKLLEQKFIDEIDKIIDGLIDKLSGFRDKIIEQTKGVFLSKEDVYFLGMIQDENFTNLKGQDLVNVFENLDLETQIEKDNQKMTQILNQLKQIEDRSMQSFIQFQQGYGQWKNENKKGDHAYFCSEAMELKNIDTKIFSTPEEIGTLISFFDKKPIKKLSLLYRASENGFSTPVFYDKCSNIPNTVIIAKTENGKIIGGFTPIPWKRYDTATYQVADQSRESFIFSVSEGNKLVLEDEQFATYYLNSSPGPRFGKNGYADFWICNNSNTSNISYVFGYMAYRNKNYEQNTRSYEKFLGGPTEYFRTKEWEVYEVLFD